MNKWKERCYFDDIPDEVSLGIQKSLRAPSYKAIAIAILNNDLNFLSLGFSRDETELSKSLIDIKNRNEKQGRLF